AALLEFFEVQTAVRHCLAEHRQYTLPVRVGCPQPFRGSSLHHTRQQYFPTPWPQKKSLGPHPTADYGEPHDFVVAARKARTFPGPVSGLATGDLAPRGRETLRRHHRRQRPRPGQIGRASCREKVKIEEAWGT